MTLEWSLNLKSGSEAMNEAEYMNLFKYDVWFDLEENERMGVLIAFST